MNFLALSPRLRRSSSVLLASGMFFASVASSFAIRDRMRAGEYPVDPSIARYTPTALPSDILHLVGADTMDEIAFNWSKEFKRIYPQMDVTVEARGSITSGPALISGQADLAPTAREFLPREEADFVKKFGYEPFMIRIGTGSFASMDKTHALAVIVNRANPIAGLTLPELDAIFSKSRKRGHAPIMTWGDLGLTGEWASRPIVAYNRPPNGMTGYFRYSVMENGEFADNLVVRKSVGPDYVLDTIAKEVAANPAAIGYISFIHLARGDKAVPLAMGPSEPFVAGTHATVFDHTYPLSRWIYLAVNRPPGKPIEPKVLEFLKYALSREGQQVISDEGIFMPLSAATVAEELRRLQ